MGDENGHGPAADTVPPLMVFGEGFGAEVVRGADGNPQVVVQISNRVAVATFTLTESQAKEHVEGLAAALARERLVLP